MVVLLDTHVPKAVLESVLLQMSPEGVFFSGSGSRFTKFFLGFGRMR